MKVKLDENLSCHLKELLQDVGLDVSTAAEEGLLGRPDTEIGAAARKEERMIFTLDLEFADLRKFRPGTHPGVILFRPRSMGPLYVNRWILEFAQKTNVSELSGCVVVVEPGRVRLRRSPLDADESGWAEIPPR